jgi:hypothetical protein
MYVCHCEVVNYQTVGAAMPCRLAGDPASAHREIGKNLYLAQQIDG